MEKDERMEQVINWLKHPAELGKEPAEIEFVKEFTDPEGFNCQIYKFKADKGSPWLLAINSDSGVFSEQEEYDAEHDVEQAQYMLDYLKQHWKNMALNEEQKKERAARAKKFAGFVLKKEPIFDPDTFIKMYREDWGEELKDSDDDTAKKDGVDARILTTESGLSLILGYMDFRIPGEEAEANAQYNFMWKDAVEVTKTHTAHEVVTVMGKGDIREQAFLYSKVIITLCRMDNNIGVYANGIVYEPKMVVAMKKIVEENDLPIPILVWCGIGREENGISAWTDGMKNFGFDELEIVGIQKNPNELHNIMLYIIDYCINNDISFNDGQTFGLTPGVNVEVKKSKGFNVDEDGETLKLIIHED